MTNHLQETLTGLFASKVRAQALGYLIPRNHRGFSLSELARATGISTSSLQHECYKLASLGILTDRREGNARRYSVNNDHPMVPALTTLVVLGVGMGPMLRAAVEDLDLTCRVAIAGSLDPGADPASVLVVGDATFLDFSVLEGRLANIFRAVDLPLPPLAYYADDDWQARLRSGNALVATWCAGPGTTVFGPPIVPSWGP